MAFIDIKNEVLANVIDLPPAVSAAVPKLINNAIRSAERRYNFQYMAAVAQYITIPNVTVLNNLTPLYNFKEFRDDGAYLLKQYSPGERLHIVASRADIEEAVVINPTLPGSKPRWMRTNTLADSGKVFSVGPLPNNLSDWSDGNWIVVIQYYGFTPVLAADADTNWLINNGDDYIVMRATAEAFMKDWDYNSLALWKQQDQEKFNELRLMDKKARLAGMDTWVPFWEGANQAMVE